jgi:hypothetical protein
LLFRVSLPATRRGTSARDRDARGEQSIQGGRGGPSKEAGAAWTEGEQRGRESALLHPQ